MAGIIATLQDDKGTNLYPQIKFDGILDFPTTYVKTSAFANTGWTTAGLTLINGGKFNETDNATYGYEKFTINGHSFVIISLYLNNPSTDDKDVLTLPFSVKGYNLVAKVFSGETYALVYDNKIRIGGGTNGLNAHVTGTFAIA